MENWCVIPARGGSKAIPRKNLAPLAGYPLVAYVICAARAARTVSRVIVSTDDPEIARVTASFGAEAPFLRPKELATDASPTLPAIVHAVTTLEREEKRRPELVTLLQPTSPFTRPDQIDAAVERLLADPTADSVTTVLEIDHVNHPYNVRRIGPDGSMDFFLKDEHYRFPTRQSKPPFYRFGNLYVMRRDVLIEKESLFGDRCLPEIVDLASCFDINDREDLRMAELMVSAGIVEPKRWMTAGGARR
jgi:N-acylneuraminate cytidylyltransferase/CMP-N,N'-diacetyllegionaminic acid synthase